MSELAPAADRPAAVTEPELPLRRNRVYHLLWIGTTASETGLNVSTIAFPLLALATTGSPGWPAR